MTGATGGQYTSTSGLVINKTSGTVDLAKSSGATGLLTASATAMAVQIHGCCYHDPCVTNATIAYGTYCARIVQK
ncbi:hypothetical protein [Filimonas lacunae]|uniref:hypothetical protein n=1 Tax=Filimonas lacunae TaxID=477680 RepID=UPI0007D7155F|nr:hypothetical protein [Filimonas lacunae]BAV05863.1 cell wall surface anchor family protein [Filimonas lacunae]